MTTFAVAGIQMAAPVDDNLDRIRSRIEAALSRFPWVQMIVFGELGVFGPRPSTAQTMPGPAENYLAALAKKHGIWLIPGSMYELADDKIYNTAPVFDPNGDVVVRYRKIYPFLPYERGVEAGNTCTTFDVPNVGRFGISICYDMWFPETTRTLAWMGAEVIIHPTLTNTIDRELELPIARSSAIVNQCYFVDINSTGELAYGKSIVLGPEGEVLHTADRGEEIIPVVLDFERVRRVRREGTLGLGQPLKSFRDNAITYPQYITRESSRSRYLRSLGPLELPMRDRGKALTESSEPLNGRRHR